MHSACIIPARHRNIIKISRFRRGGGRRCTAGDVQRRCTAFVNGNSDWQLNRRRPWVRRKGARLGCAAHRAYRSPHLSSSSRQLRQLTVTQRQTSTYLISAAKYLGNIGHWQDIEMWFDVEVISLSVLMLTTDFTQIWIRLVGRAAACFTWLLLEFDRLLDCWLKNGSS